MHTQLVVSHDLRRLATEQSGVVTAQQLERHGISRHAAKRRVATGHWLRLAPGVFAMSPLPPTWLALAWAGVLLGGPHATLSGVTAARLWGFAPHDELPIQVLVPDSTRARANTSWWVFRRTRTPLRPRGAPPRTSVERTVLDLCAAEPNRCVHWVTAAVGSRSTTTARLFAALKSTSQHRARRQLTELLGDVQQGAHSPLEVRYLRDVERAHGLGAGRRQVRSRGHIRDVEYPERLIVELDGQLGHTGSAAFRDMDRDNHNLLRGFHTLRFGWQQCQHDPCRVAARVAQARISLGWQGTLQRCKNCQHIPEQELLTW